MSAGRTLSRKNITTKVGAARSSPVSAAATPPRKPKRCRSQARGAPAMVPMISAAAATHRLVRKLCKNATMKPPVMPFMPRPPAASASG